MPRFLPTLLMRQPWSVMTARFLSNYRLFLYASFKVDLQIQNRTQSSQRSRPVVLKWLSWLHLIVAIFVDFCRILLPSNSKQFSYAAAGLEIRVSNRSKCYHVFSFATGMLRQWSAAALPLQILVEQHCEFTSALGIHLLDMNSAIRFQICIDIDHIWITQVQYVSFCCRNCCRVLAVDHRVTRTSSS